MCPSAVHRNPANWPAAHKWALHCQLLLLLLLLLLLSLTALLLWGCRAWLLHCCWFGWVQGMPH
jgi:hypothetical protein